MHKILIVEDETVLLDAYKILLGTQPEYEVYTATNGQEAFEACQKNTFDIILLDLMMPQLDGVGFLKKAKLTDVHPHTKVLIMSNLSSGDLLSEALQLGAQDHYVKSSLGPSELISIIKEHVNTPISTSGNLSK